MVIFRLVPTRQYFPSLAHLPLRRVPHEMLFQSRFQALNISNHVRAPKVTDFPLGRWRTLGRRVRSFMEVAPHRRRIIGHGQSIPFSWGEEADKFAGVARWLRTNAVYADVSAVGDRAVRAGPDRLIGKAQMRSARCQRAQPQPGENRRP